VILGHDDGHAGGYPAQQAAHGRRRRDLGFPPARLDLPPGGFHDYGAGGVGQQPHYLSIEPFTLSTDAGQEIRQRLPFDGDDVLQAQDGVVTRGERADFDAQRMQPLCFVSNSRRAVFLRATP
jgi:hypothetical protein